MGELVRAEFWEPLGDEVCQGLREWIRGQPYDIEPAGWLGGGNSGSRIAVIERTGGGFDDKVAVKFLADASETSRWQAAITCDPEFSAHHLVGIEPPSLLSPRKSSWWIATLKIAGGDLSSVRPLAELRPNVGPDFALVCQTIVRSVVVEWNPWPLRHRSESVHPAHYLNGIFDINRVKPGKPLQEWLDAETIGLHDLFVHRPGWGHRLPNPLAFITNADSLLADRRTRVMYGHAHGDLHTRNIMMEIRPARPEQYKLIDLGCYDSRSPLARDPMHLLLSVSLEWLRSGITAGSERSHSLISVIVDGDSEAAGEEYRQVSKAIHGAGHELVTPRGRGDEWREQSLLSLVGCALRYASRKFPDVENPDATRGWFFDLAAVATRAYLEHAGLWGRYVDMALASPPPSSVAAPPTDVSHVSGHQSITSSPDPAVGDAGGAQVLLFRGRSRRRDPASITAKTTSGASDQGTWEDLASALRAVTFSGADWEVLAARTEALRRQLGRKRPPHPTSDKKLRKHLLSLEQTLAAVLKPFATSAELNSACMRADTLRGWLVDLLDEPGR